MAVGHVIEVIISNKAVVNDDPQDLLVAVANENTLGFNTQEGIQPKRGNGLVIPFKKGFLPNWGKMAPLDSNYNEIIDYFRNGKRIVLFMIGGMTLSEIKAVHQATETFHRDIIIGI